ncbi:MAG TPA: hypothetical protein VIF36_02970 [Gaiellaceae bacterium]
MKRRRRNLVERETAKQRALTDELRHHDPFGPPELVFAHEAILIRLRAAR